jgi:hypothetical protein
MKPILCGVLSAWVATSLLDAGEVRTFTDNKNREIEAEVLSVGENTVKLRRADGKTFSIDPEILSDDDRRYLEDFRNADSDRIKKLNEAAGHEVFTDVSLLDRPAEEVAKALSMPAESTSPGLRSWRLYASRAMMLNKKPFTLFGAMPFSLAMYGSEDDKVSQISAVYANKGDFGSTAGFGEDHFSGGAAAPEDLEEAMQRDFDAITKSLSSALGPPTSQRFGEGKSRRTVERWDWNELAILLALEEEEFVGLTVVSSELADSGGKTERVNDTLIKERIAKAVVREDNGDVIISGIPMVDQGPKGYCVPATFERAMRFMGMDADMYLLAMVGQTNAGGGTSPTLLIEEVKSQVYRKARRTKDDDPDKLSLSRITRYIDDGIPVMWTMFSLNEYNELANENTKARKEVEDWEEWLQKVSVQSVEYEKRDRTPGNHHICMIIGYNAKTNELAVSDSWGARYELRWVPLELANWVHGGGFFMIMP